MTREHLDYRLLEFVRRAVDRAVHEDGLTTAPMAESEVNDLAHVAVEAIRAAETPGPWCGVKRHSLGCRYAEHEGGDPAVLSPYESIDRLHAKEINRG